MDPLVLVCTWQYSALQYHRLAACLGIDGDGLDGAKMHARPGQR